MSKPRHSERLVDLAAKPGRVTTTPAWRELRLAKCWPPPITVKTTRDEAKKSPHLVRPK